MANVRAGAPRPPAVLVVGGSSGIGAATSEVLAARGWNVAVHGLEEIGAAATADRLRQSGGIAIALAGSVTSAEDMAAAVRETVTRFGGLDCLVYSAGIQRYGTAESTDESTWDEVVSTNLKGAFLAAKYAIPELRKSNSPSIVMVSSVQAFATQQSVAAYAASKGGLLALARSIAVDEAQHGIRVNTVSPASVDTPMLRSEARLLSSAGDPEGDQLIDEWGKAYPLGRIATATEVGHVIGFLASDEASFVTGADFRVDGGLLASLGVALPVSALTRSNHS